MARLAYDGRTNVYWLTVLDDVTAPTEGEIAAGTDITSFITKDGVQPNLTTNNVDSATIAEIFDAQVVGTFGADFQLTMKRDDTNDTAWDLCVYGTAGYIVVDEFNESGTAPSAGDPVDVWPAQMHQPTPANSSSNTEKTFTESFAITAAPQFSVLVATGT